MIFIADPSEQVYYFFRIFYIFSLVFQLTYLKKSIFF
jgi:hypothetical protein